MQIVDRFVCRCTYCGAECREGARYCDACGERLELLTPEEADSDPLIEEKAAEERRDEFRETASETQQAVDEVQESKRGIGKAEDGSSEDSVPEGDLPEDEATEDDISNLAEETAVVPADENDSIIGIDEKLDRLLKLFEDRIARTDYEALTMKKLSDELQSYRDDLYRKLTLPLVKDLISVREALTSTQASYASANDEDATVPLSVVEMFSTMIKEALRKYGVEAVAPSPGDELVALSHKAIDKVPTDDEQLHGRIASVSSDCYMQAGSCIVPAMVTIFAYEQGKDIDEEAGRAAEPNAEQVAQKRSE